MTMEALQRRIKTTEDLREIVETMKSLSAVSILQYDEAQKSLIRYEENVESALQGLLKRHVLRHLPNRIPPENSRTLFILIGSDNGLVGRFNRDIIRKSEEYAKEKKIENPMYVIFGKRLLSSLKGKDVRAHFSLLNSISVINSAATLVMKEIDSLLSKGVKRVVLIHNKRLAGTTLPETKAKLIYPTDPETFKELEKKKWPTNKVPIFSMNPEKLYSSLLQEMLICKVSLALASSLAAEYHTRLINMQAAEKNIDESLEAMTLTYQQMRQEAITSEIIDVVTGANAMGKKKKKSAQKS